MEPEWLTRKRRIDEKLTAAGWQVRPWAHGQSLAGAARSAVTEFPTENGPADYALVDGGRDLRRFGSQGEQRRTLLALILAEADVIEAERDEPPLLLLDDVFSELDPLRRAQLVRRIGELPQAFITTTALTDLHPRLVAASTPWRVTPGRLEPLPT